MRRVGIAMFLVGGGTAMAGVWTTQATDGSRLGQGVIAAAFLLAAVALLVVRRARPSALVGMALAAIVGIGGMVAVSDPLGMAATFFLWPVVYLAYFSTKQVVGVAMVLMVASLGTALLVNDDLPLRADTFLGAASSVGLMAWLVATMTARQTILSVELAEAASTDPLTGLLNRRALHQRLGALVEAARTSDRRIAVAAFDLDRFKMINDGLGHDAGDRVLQHVARTLLSSSREDDLVVRMGGEEFLVVLPGGDVDAALALAARVAASVRQVPDLEIPVETSVGVCELGGDVRQPDDLLRCADEALYAAKQAGRGRAAVWAATADLRVGAPFRDEAARGEGVGACDPGVLRATLGA